MHEHGLKPNSLKQGLRWFLIGLAIVAAVASWSSNRKSMLTDADAFYLCSEAITSVSLDASVVEIPDIAATNTGSGFELLWTTEDGLKLPDASGKQVDAVVVCHVNNASAAVEHLEFNGETIFTRKRSSD